MSVDLFEAIRKGDASALKEALAAGADFDVRNEGGDTLLMQAAEIGGREMVDALLDAGADIGTENDYGFDALATALWCGKVELARRLVERGAKVDVNSAAALGDLERLNHECPASRDLPVEEMVGAYLGACRTGQTEVVEWFLKRGMPADLHPPGEEWGGIGGPGMHHAAVNGHAETVRLLLDYGADVSLVDDVHGSQALAWAASGGQGEVVEMLLDAGSHPTHRNAEGLSAADLAKSNGFEELAEFLASSRED